MTSYLKAKIFNTYKLELFIYYVGQAYVKVFQFISIEFSVWMLHVVCCIVYSSVQTNYFCSRKRNTRYVEAKLWE